MQARKKMRSRKFNVITVFLVIIGLASFVTYERILIAIGDFLIIQDQLQPADVIHVIAGDNHRTDYAIILYKKGYSKKIFFSGGLCKFHNVYHGQQGKMRSLKMGLPIEAIAIDESKVTSTYSEALRLKEFIKGSKETIRSVIVVSDIYHMYRSHWTYRKVLDSQIKIQMAPVPFDQSPFQARWWTDKRSRKMVKNEYLKLGYYFARYHLSRGRLKDWLASLDKE